MKILAIGNSFSEDATRYLEPIARSAGEELFVRNLYIGGCSLKTHAENIENCAEAYQYQQNAAMIEMTSINKALTYEDWDFVTVQQVSGDSGMINSYEPYLTYVLDTIKAACPKAKLAFHRTWAYEIDSAHGNFVRYDKNQIQMYGAIVAATTRHAAEHSLPIIRSGDFVQVLRTLPEFDYANGGKTLCRDGFHMSHEYGRFAVALAWYKFFTGASAKKVTFAPDGAESALLDKIKEMADKAL